MKKQPMDKPFTYTYFLFSVNSPAHSFFFWLACCCLFFLLLFFCFWSSVSFPITFIHTRIRAFHLPFLITWNHKHQCITQIPKLKVDGFDCETSSTIHSHEFFAYIRNVEHTAYRSDCIYVPHRVILPSGESPEIVCSDKCDTLQLRCVSLFTTEDVKTRIWFIADIKYCVHDCERMHAIAAKWCTWAVNGLVRWP